MRASTAKTPSSFSRARSATAKSNGRELRQRFTSAQGERLAQQVRSRSVADGQQRPSLGDQLLEAHNVDVDAHQDVTSAGRHHRIRADSSAQLSDLHAQRVQAVGGDVVTPDALHEAIGAG